MSDGYLVATVFFGIVLGGYFFVVLPLQTVKRNDEALRRIAGKLELTFSGGNVRRAGVATGQFEGHTVSITHYVPSHLTGAPSHLMSSALRVPSSVQAYATYTIITINLRQPHLRYFRLAEAGFFKLAGLARSVPTGDPVFDARFHLRIEPPEIGPRVIGSFFELSSKLLQLGKFWLNHKDGLLIYVKRDFSHSAGHHRKVLGVLTQLATALESYQG